MATALAPKSAPKAPLGGSTKSMLVRMEQAIGQANVPPTNPYFVSQIRDNVGLKQVQDSVSRLKDDRDSLFRVEAELSGTLIPALEKSALKPDVRNSLLHRVKELKERALEPAMLLDSTFGTIETSLAALETQRLMQKQERYKEIQMAANPIVKAEELLKNEEASQSSIKEHERQAAQAAKLFQHHLSTIEREYTFLRDAAPGSLRMRTLTEMRTTTSPDLTTSAEAQPTRMQGTRGA